MFSAQPGARDAHQQPVADISPSRFHSLGTADRPLSSFAQKGNGTGPAGAAGSGNRTAAEKQAASPQSQQLHGTADVVAVGNAQAARQQTPLGLLASDAAFAESDVASADAGLQQEGSLAQPLFGASHMPSESSRPDLATSRADPSIPLLGRGTEQREVDHNAGTHQAQLHSTSDSKLAQEHAPSADSIDSHACGGYQQGNLGAGLSATATGSAAMGTPLPALSQVQGSMFGNAGDQLPDAAGVGMSVASAQSLTVIDSPSSFGGSFLGQSMDLSKASLFLAMFCF